MKIRRDLTFLIACISIVIIQYIIGMLIVNHLEFVVNELTVENELLRNELVEYEGLTELFPNYCVKCYCKDICQEAINEKKGVK